MKKLMYSLFAAAMLSFGAPMVAPGVSELQAKPQHASMMVDEDLIVQVTVFDDGTICWRWVEMSTGDTVAEIIAYSNGRVVTR